MKYKIAGIGEILWDIYGTEKYLGGATANFAFHAHKLGNEGIIVSKVGRDKLGEEIIQSLEKKGLDTNLIQRDGSHPTGTVHIKLLAGSVPKFLCGKNAAFDYIEFDKNLESLSKRCDAVTFGSLAQRNEVSKKTIGDFLQSLEKAVVFYDVNFRGAWKNHLSIVKKSLPFTDILKFTDIEFIKVKKLFNKEDIDNISFLNFLLNEFKIKLICFTFGKWGCLFFSEDEKFYSAGVKIDAVDTVGAGDAFSAALISGYLQKRPLKEIAEFSNYVGAFVASMKGATPDYSKKNLDDFISLHKDRNVKKYFNRGLGGLNRL